MTLHSALGASSMYRWSACPGSVRLSAGVELASSSYAEEGTAAHAIAADCLEKGTDSDDEAVQTYLDEVRSRIEPGDTLQIEVRFDLSSVYPGCFGTGDAIVWKPKSKLLIVFDYKHGAGIPVSANANPQLRYYGLGALLQSGYPADRVRLVIVQPRCDHGDGPVRFEEIDALDLLDFAADLKRFAQATESKDAPLVPGEHCRFCPAGKVQKCPAVKSKAQALAKMVFAPATSYDPADLARALDGREAMKAWLKNLDEFAYSEAEAGRPAPGYKLVAKMGRRKWREGAQGELAVLAPPGDEGEGDWYEPRQLKSPAQLEKIKSAGKDLVKQFAIMESSGHVLVPEDDKRPAVARLTASDVFQTQT